MPTGTWCRRHGTELRYGKGCHLIGANDVYRSGDGRESLYPAKAVYRTVRGRDELYCLTYDEVSHFDPVS